MKKVDLCVLQGEDFEYKFDAILDSNLDPVDISTYSANLQIRRRPKSNDKLLELTDQDLISLGTDGVISIEIPCGANQHFDWHSGFYDLRLTDPSSVVSFPFIGNVAIVPTVTANSTDFNNDFSCDFGA